MLVLAYNATIHDSTGYSPHYLLFGRAPRLPIDNLFQTEYKQQGIEEMREALEWAWTQASKKDKERKEYNKRYHDKRVKGSALIVGDRVLVKECAFDGPHKIKDKWSKDLFIVSRKMEGLPVYRVVKENGDQEKTLHRTLLLPVQAIREETVQEEATRAHEVAKREEVRTEPEETEQEDRHQIDADEQDGSTHETNNNDNRGSRVDSPAEEEYESDDSTYITQYKTDDPESRGYTTGSDKIENNGDGEDPSDSETSSGGNTSVSQDLEDLHEENSNDRVDQSSPNVDQNLGSQEGATCVVPAIAQVPSEAQVCPQEVGQPTRTPELVEMAVDPTAGEISPNGTDQQTPLPPKQRKSTRETRPPSWMTSGEFDMRADVQSLLALKDIVPPDKASEYLGVVLDYFRHQDV